MTEEERASNAAYARHRYAQRKAWLAANPDKAVAYRMKNNLCRKVKYANDSAYRTREQAAHRAYIRKRASQYAQLVAENQELREIITKIRTACLQNPASAHSVYMAVMQTIQYSDKKES